MLRSWRCIVVWLLPLVATHASATQSAIESEIAQLSQSKLKIAVAGS